VLPFIRQWAESAAAFDGPHVFKAYSQTHATRVATVAASAPFDYVLSPVAPNLPASAQDPAPTNDPLRPLEHIAFTVPFNMSEQPAASINCGYSASGLPIGLQIAGRRFDDLGVLQVARAFEQIRGAQRPWPQPQKRMNRECRKDRQNAADQGAKRRRSSGSASICNAERAGFGGQGGRFVHSFQ
jgi:aspartyl-tRNA(Asn)/glutamyl-tRNA(Gln) amidotransferase subunit A